MSSLEITAVLLILRQDPRTCCQSLSHAFRHDCLASLRKKKELVVILLSFCFYQSGRSSSVWMIGWSLMVLLSFWSLHTHLKIGNQVQNWREGWKKEFGQHVKHCHFWKFTTRDGGSESLKLVGHVPHFEMCYPQTTVLCFIFCLFVCFWNTAL